jgi:3-deoxy-D-manno-octulosonic-acid transferase
MSGLGLYRLATAVLEPLAPLALRWRAHNGKEDPRRIRERLGRTSLPRPEGPLVWLHGASVGESLSLLPLIDRIRTERPDVSVLVTSGTVTSAGLLAKRLPDGVIHQYAPVDGPLAVRRFLDHWRPDAGLFAESELWPNLIGDAHDRGVKLALVSARITAHSAEGWAKRPTAARKLLAAFGLILPQDKASAARLAALGGAPGPLLNLKYVAVPLPFDPKTLKPLKAALASRRPIVLAASTHAGDEALIAQACPPGPLLIIAVRHPNRGPAAADELRNLGRHVARRAAGDDLTAEADIYVADTLGEMGLWFALADVAVMGGAFTDGIGGHNPLEPARLDIPVISGPHAFNFADVYDGLQSADAAIIASAEDLAAALSGLLADSAKQKSMARKAHTYADAQGQAFEAGWALIRELLP